MSHWTTARKGPTLLHLSYGHTFTNNLYGYDTQVRAEPGFEIRIDLSPNLRTRNKQTNTYTDARELAGGELGRLTLLQVTDDTILRTIGQALKTRVDRPRLWKLTLDLEGEWTFWVEPELRDHGSHSLFLHVRDPESRGT